MAGGITEQERRLARDHNIDVHETRRSSPTANKDEFRGAMDDLDLWLDTNKGNINGAIDPAYRNKFSTYAKVNLLTLAVLKWGDDELGGGS